MLFRSSTSSTETDQEEIVEEVEVMEEEIDMDIPFAIIEDVPLFPGCERVAKSKRRDCFQQKMSKHISDNFRYPDIHFYQFKLYKTYTYSLISHLI